MFSLLFSIACSLYFVQAVIPPAPISFVNSHVSFKDIAHNLSEAINMTNTIMDKLMETQKLPSMVFGISIRNKTIHKRAAGFAEIEEYTPININASYRMASVTKTFTSTLIGTLVDAGKLNYNDSIYDHLPAGAFPPKFIDGKQVKITVGNLLSHMAGTHETNLTDFFHITFPANSTESIKYDRGEPLYFEPGTDYRYSNYGFQILGAIIENITGQSYQDAMDNFIQKRLNLSDGTLIERDTTAFHGRQRPRYYRMNETMLETIPVGVYDQALFSTGIWAAGGLVSNVDDLLAYGNLILDSYHERPNAILKKSTMNEIWTKRTGKAPHFPLRPINEYGYGWMIAHIPESTPNVQHRDFNWHSGGLVGATTFLVIYPKEEIVAVAMTNKGAAKGLDVLCIDAVELMYDFVPKL